MTFGLAFGGEPVKGQDTASPPLHSQLAIPAHVAYMA